MSSLATAEQTHARSGRTVRSLAWKILYANHRPSLGPREWDELVETVSGPDDVKSLSVDEPVALEPLANLIGRLGSRLAEDPETGLERAGRAFADRWASMYQRIVDHLEERPQRMLEVAVEEIAPWFFEGTDMRIASRRDGAAEIVPDGALPLAFQAGMLERFVAQVTDPVEADTADGSINVAWRPGAPARPNALRVLAEATRVRFLTATLVPVLVGTGLAYAVGGFSTGRAGAALLAAAALHLSANLLNDVLDHRRGVDEANLTPTPFSGGSRVIQRGLLAQDRVLALAIGLAVVGVGLGVWLSLLAGVEVLALGVLGVGLGYAYSGDPFRLSHRGLGEAAVGLVFGPLIAGGAFAVQTGTLGAEALLAGVPVGLLMAGLLATNELPDAPWDERTGKRTLVVRLGDRAPVAIGAIFGAAYVSLAALVAGNVLPWPSLAGLATVPLAGHVVQGARRHGTDAEVLVPYQAAAFWLHATAGLLIAAGIVAGGI